MVHTKSKNRNQLFAGVDIAYAITLIFKATREVKPHPAVVLALILVCRRATQRTARTDGQWLPRRHNESREQYGWLCPAIAAYREAIKLGDSSPDTQIYLGAAYAKAGERGKAQAILKRLETGKEYVSPEALAILHVALGQREQAFALLEHAYAAHDKQLIFLGVEPEFDPLRSDPRFQDLVRRVGLPQL